MHIAITQARSGNVNGAIKTSKHIEPPLRKNAVLLGIAFTRAKDGDIPAALAAASSIESELSRARAYRAIADVKTRKGQMGQAQLWIETLTPPIEKSSALDGAANGLPNEAGILPNGSCIRSTR